jgi:hypothetical protein
MSSIDQLDPNIGRILAWVARVPDFGHDTECHSSGTPLCPECEVTISSRRNSLAAHS